MKKLLIIHPSADLYGSDKIIASICSFLQDEYKITLLIPTTGPLIKLLDNIAPEIQIEIEPSIPVIAKKYLTFTGIIKFLRKLLKFRETAKKYRDYNITYANTLAVGPLLKFFRNRKICHVHETLPNTNILYKLLNYLSVKSADKIICVSKAVSSTLNEASRSNKTKVVYNGVASGVRHIYDEHSKQLEFSLVGRIKPSVKGHYSVLGAVNLLKKIYDNFHVTFWGDTVSGQEYMLNDLIKEIKDRKIEDFVSIRDFTDDIDLIYQSTDVTLIPSIVPDSLPTTALESIARGIPVIGSAIGGIPEIIDDGINGYIVTPNDAESLSNAMSRYLSCNSGLNRMSQNAINKFQENFSQEVFKNNILTEIAALL